MPRKISEDTVKDIIRLRRENNLSYAKIAELTGTSGNTVMNYCNRKARELSRKRARRYYSNPAGKERKKREMSEYSKTENYAFSLASHWFRKLSKEKRKELIEAFNDE